ncbi:hypothetical protein FOA52_002785 [Chlamydomonas sp. UWO 241]|nr:hypothetical protein FOA52_002785 [Chlamydomonas sp. UWO 241]
MLDKRVRALTRIAEAEHTTAAAKVLRDLSDDALTSALDGVRCQIDLLRLWREEHVDELRVEMEAGAAEKLREGVDEAAAGQLHVQQVLLAEGEPSLRVQSAELKARCQELRTRKAFLANQAGTGEQAAQGQQQQQQPVSVQQGQQGPEQEEQVGRPRDGGAAAAAATTTEPQQLHQPHQPPPQQQNQQQNQQNQHHHHHQHQHQQQQPCGVSSRSTTLCALLRRVCVCCPGRVPLPPRTGSTTDVDAVGASTSVAPLQPRPPVVVIEVLDDSDDDGAGSGGGGGRAGASGSGGGGGGAGGSGGSGGAAAPGAAPPPHAAGGASGGGGGDGADSCAVCLCSITGEAQVYPCGHYFCSLCSDQLLKAPHPECPMCRRGVSRAHVFRVTIAPSGSGPGPAASGLGAAASHDPEVDPPEGPSLRRVRVFGSFMTKVEGLVRRLLWLREASPGEKVLVFSQFRDALVLLSKALDVNKVRHVKMLSGGGGGAAAVRGTLRMFNEDDDVRVLLLSLQTQAAGLTLVRASHVFLLEPAMDPAIEQQAVARVHRIGQTRETVVTRLLVDGTVEMEVLRVLQRKQQLFVDQLHQHQEDADGSTTPGSQLGGGAGGGGQGEGEHGAEAEAAAGGVGLAEGEIDADDADQVMVALAANAPRHEQLDERDARSLLDALM